MRGSLLRLTLLLALVVCSVADATKAEEPTVLAVRVGQSCETLASINANTVLLYELPQRVREFVLCVDAPKGLKLTKKDVGLAVKFKQSENVVLERLESTSSSETCASGDKDGDVSAVEPMCFTIHATDERYSPSLAVCLEKHEDSTFTIEQSCFSLNFVYELHDVVIGVMERAAFVPTLNPKQVRMRFAVNVTLPPLKKEGQEPVFPLLIETSHDGVQMKLEKPVQTRDSSKLTGSSTVVWQPDFSDSPSEKFILHMLTISKVTNAVPERLNLSLPLLITLPEELAFKDISLHVRFGSTDDSIVLPQPIVCPELAKVHFTDAVVHFGYLSTARGDIKQYNGSDAVVNMSGKVIFPLGSNKNPWTLDIKFAPAFSNPLLKHEWIDLPFQKNLSAAFTEPRPVLRFLMQEHLEINDKEMQTILEKDFPAMYKVKLSAVTVGMECLLATESVSVSATLEMLDRLQYVPVEADAKVGLTHLRKVNDEAPYARGELSVGRRIDDFVWLEVSNEGPFEKIPLMQLRVSTAASIVNQDSRVAESAPSSSDMLSISVVLMSPKDVTSLLPLLDDASRAKARQMNCHFEKISCQAASKESLACTIKDTYARDGDEAAQPWSCALHVSALLPSRALEELAEPGRSFRIDVNSSVQIMTTSIVHDDVTVTYLSPSEHPVQSGLRLQRLVKPVPIPPSPSPVRGSTESSRFTWVVILALIAASAFLSFTQQGRQLLVDTLDWIKSKFSQHRGGTHRGRSAGLASLRYTPLGTGARGTALDDDEVY